MDNFGSSNFGDDDFKEPIPFDSLGGGDASSSPMDLDRGDSEEKIPSISPASTPTEPTVVKPGKAIVSSDRITGVKTFFTKLHSGSIDFLDEIITDWLSDNPGLTVKRTNMVIGEVHSKTTEPNLIVSVWY